jgi:hypothetical protein
MAIILGCWYSNNGINQQILTASLRSIEKAVLASDVPVHVKTCTYSKPPDSSFTNYLAHCQMASHLGIAMQILRLILEADSEGMHYDIVCFLEHDVLYPESYFSTVARAMENDPASTGVINCGYLGLNQTGWLKIREQQYPMHQTSLRGQYARAHIQRIVEDCIVKGAVALEPDPAKLFKLHGDTPSVHINHGRHFTSHYDTFVKDSGGWLDHPYWGNFRAFYPDGEKARNT